MLIWYYGSSMILSAAVTDDEGAPQSGATVTYDLRERDGDVFYSGTLTEVGTSGTYKDSIDPDEAFGEYWEDENPEELRRKLYKARVAASLPSGLVRESWPRLQLLFDTD